MLLTPRILIAIATLTAGIVAARAAESAAPPEDFWGLKWGASKEEAKAAMKANGGKIIARYTSETHLGFGDGTLAGMNVKTWDLDFAGDKFCRGGVQFADTYDNDGLFKQVKKLLTDKYGTRKSETFKPADASAEWRLMAPSATEGILIRLSIGGHRNAKSVRLEYTNEALAKLAPPARPEPQVKGDGL
jgi:hypothetical protein